MTKPVIGFIGLGLMGGNMVENLQKRGYHVNVMDLALKLLLALQIAATQLHSLLLKN